MKNIIFLILISGIFFPSLFAQPRIKIEGHLQKNTYLLGEPIDFVLSIINTSNEEINGKFEGLKIGLLNPSNIYINHGIRSNGFPSTLSVKLEPKDTVYWSFDLIEVFGNSYDASPLYLYLPAGNYTLEISLTSSDIQIQNEKLPFQIIKPKDSEAIVYNTFMNLVSRKHTSYEEAETLESIYNKYPNSVYAPFILMVLEANYDIKLKDHKKSLAIRKELLKNYPSTNIAKQMLDGVLKSLPNDLDRIEFLKKVQAGSKGNLMGKVYEKKLEALKKKE